MSSQLAFSTSSLLSQFSYQSPVDALPRSCRPCRGPQNFSAKNPTPSTLLQLRLQKELRLGNTSIKTNLSQHAGTSSTIWKAPLTTCRATEAPQPEPAAPQPKRQQQSPDREAYYVIERKSEQVEHRERELEDFHGGNGSVQGPLGMVEAKAQGTPPRDSRRSEGGSNQHRHGLGVSAGDKWKTVIASLGQQILRIPSLLPLSTSLTWQPARKELLSGFAAVGLALALMTSALDADAIVAAPHRQLSGDELATVELFQENTPSVVYITNLAVRRDAFTLDVMAVPQGSGSGFIWDKRGHVVTNYHVIRGASDLRVTLQDQSVFEASVVGFDEDKDVAVLHIDAPAELLRPMPIGSSADLLVGQKVFAIGNPFGLDHTLTTGVISGLRREISSAATGRPIQDVIQTDAAINPGNSGGPLLDSAGNLIGINTAIYSPSGASSGVGFSIPVDTVSGIVEQIVKYGKVTRPVLGISFAPEQSVEQLGVSGVLVLDAPPTGPAGKAGLKPTTRDNYGRLVLGDIITMINGQKVKNGSDLYKILDKCNVGDVVRVTVLRGESTTDVNVTLEPKD
eukprot:jgi/Mesen1/2032/ME000148S01124